jgi:hypothetical protein
MCFGLNHTSGETLLAIVDGMCKTIMSLAIFWQKLGILNSDTIKVITGFRTEKKDSSQLTCLWEFLWTIMLCGL